MTDRPNDPAVARPRGPVLAKSTPDRGRAAPSRSSIDGTAAHRDVAAFIAARAEARATSDLADDPTTNGDVDPSPRLDAVPDPEPVAPELPPRPDARPRIVEDPVILGLSRVSRSRLGSRLFALFFVFVYALILVQLIVSLLQT